jgi:hypothetical protein
MQNLDANLLREQFLTEDKQRQAAQQLRYARGYDDKDVGQPSSHDLRAMHMSAKRDRERTEMMKEKLKEKMSAPAHQGTGMALKFAWLNLIPSFGLTLIYINIHVFLRQVFPSIFCPLGQELVPKQALAAGGEAGKSAGKAFGLFEIMGLLALDFIALFAVICILGLIVMIVTFMGASWWEKLKYIWDAIWALSWGVALEIAELF